MTAAFIMENGELVLAINYWFMAPVTIWTACPPKILFVTISQLIRMLSLTRCCAAPIATAAPCGLDPARCSNSPVVGAAEAAGRWIFTETGFVGAFDPNQPLWSNNWTALDAYGHTGDISGGSRTLSMFPQILQQIQHGQPTTNTWWTVLIFVDPGAELIIQPGTIIKAKQQSSITTGDGASALIVRRGAESTLAERQPARLFSPANWIIWTATSALSIADCGAVWLFLAQRPTNRRQKTRSKVSAGTRRQIRRNERRRQLRCVCMRIDSPRWIFHQRCARRRNQRFDDGCCWQRNRNSPHRYSQIWMTVTNGLAAQWTNIWWQLLRRWRIRLRSGFPWQTPILVQHSSSGRSRSRRWTRRWRRWWNRNTVGDSGDQQRNPSVLAAQQRPQATATIAPSTSAITPAVNITTVSLRFHRIRYHGWRSGFRGWQPRASGKRRTGAEQQHLVRLRRRQYADRHRTQGFCANPPDRQ